MWIPHFNITQPGGDDASTASTGDKAAQTEWRQIKLLNNNEIDFDMVKRWITTCKTDHGKKCTQHDKTHVPARRLIDVDRSCLVDGSMAEEYMALSYV